MFSGSTAHPARNRVSNAVDRSVTDSRDLAAMLNISHVTLCGIIDEICGTSGDALRFSFRVKCEPGGRPVRFVVMDEEQVRFVAAYVTEIRSSRGYAAAHAKLAECQAPIDRVAARVAFPSGKDELVSWGDEAVGAMKLPPRHRVRPIDVPNYAGLHSGRLTAIFWFSGASWWVVRCACGRFAFRNVANWGGKHSHSEDCCEHCRRVAVRARGGSSRDRKAERFLAWGLRLKSMGLADEEVCDIVRLGGIDTHEKSLSEIRAQLEQARAAVSRSTE